MATLSEKIDEVQARAGRFILRWKDSRNQLTDVEYAGYRPDEISLEVFHDGTLALGVSERVGGRYLCRRLLCESEGARVRRFLHRVWQRNGFRGDRYQGVYLPIPIYLREAIARAEAIVRADQRAGEEK